MLKTAYLKNASLSKASKLAKKKLKGEKKKKINLKLQKRL